jgi:hypothetical protein
MSKTPRTDSTEKHAYEFDDDMTPVCESKFARELERELNAANARIAALMESGDALAEEAQPDRFCDLETDGRRRDALKCWEKAKEAKP